MRKLLVLITIMALTLSNVIAQEQLKINTSKSTVKWSGEYSFYFGGHNGTISITEGYFIKTNTVITGGKFNIDMNSIICLDIEDDEANEGLINHLKNDDFFEVEKYPEATIEITAVEYHNNTSMKIYANLNIKGITLPESFQAEVDYSKQQLTAKFKIDRQRWGIDYKSKFRDGAIADGIGFEVILSL
ncbi:YceI family protein [Winogradskyella sp. PE311]|uniref:YceI family protein n=1 Tax=Winogradskyella sp. PE311 TaxID=3366943 RepID=UPI00397FB794